jgi:hypothetical protein
VRHSKCGGIEDGRVGCEDGVDFGGQNFFAAAIDYLLEAASDEEVAVVVKAAEVAGAEPAVEKGGAVGFGIVEVAGENGGAADEDFAFCSGREEISGGVEDGDVEAAGTAGNIGTVAEKGDRFNGDIVSFGCAVSVQQRDAQEILELLPDFGWQRRSGRLEKTERDGSAR